MALSDVMEPFIWGQGGARLTPEQIARRREIADSLMQGDPAFSGQAGWAGILGRGLEGALAGYNERRSGRAEQQNALTNQQLISDALIGAGPQQFPDAPGASVGDSSVDPASQRVAQAFGDSALPSSFLAAVDQHEGAGGYDTLFGHAQRGQFAGTDVSKMTVGQAMAFADPSGPYAQSVKAKIGRVATPMGRHQIVGKTLRTAAQEMGLDPSTPFNQQTQDAIAAHLARRRVASAGTMEGKVKALRSEWAGLKSVPYSQMVQIVTDLENGGTGSPRSAPVQVASLDPSAGMGTSAVPPEYAATGLSQVAWDRMNVPDGGMPSPGPANIPIAGGKGGRVSVAQAAPVQMQPGPIPNPGPEQSAFLGRMTDPQPMGGAPMPMQGGVDPQQTAQIAPQQDLSQIPVMAGGTAGALPPGQAQQGINPAIIEALSSPYADEGTKRIAGLLLGQQMEAQQQANDPMRAIEMQIAQEKLNQMRNPQPQPTDTMRNLEWRAQQAGLQPGTPEYSSFMQTGGAVPQTQVNVGAGEKAWDQESAKLFAKRYDDLSAAAGNAQQMMGMYDLAEGAMNSGVRTGLGGDAELTLRQMGAALGLDTDPEKLAGGELIRAVQNRMALTMRSPDGGMGMPGALSDRDIKFLKDSQIGIDRSPEGNRKMLAAFRAMEQRKIDIAQLADQYVQENGRLDSGFNKAVRDYAAANPLFPEEPDGKAGKPITEMSDEELEAIINGNR